MTISKCHNQKKKLVNLVGLASPAGVGEEEIIPASPGLTSDVKWQASTGVGGNFPVGPFNRQGHLEISQYQVTAVLNQFVLEDSMQMQFQQNVQNILQMQPATRNEFLGPCHGLWNVQVYYPMMDNVKYFLIVGIYSALIYVAIHGLVTEELVISFGFVLLMVGRVYESYYNVKYPCNATDSIVVLERCELIHVKVMELMQAKLQAAISKTKFNVEIVLNANTKTNGIGVNLEKPLQVNGKFYIQVLWENGETHFAHVLVTLAGHPLGGGVSNSHIAKRT